MEKPGTYQSVPAQSEDSATFCRSTMRQILAGPGRSLQRQVSDPESTVADADPGCARPALNEQLPPRQERPQEMSDSSVGLAPFSSQ